MHGVTISELIEKMKLRNTTPDIDTDKIVLTHPDVNRPALQLTGFFDHFDRERVQIIGYVEQAYINTMDQERKRLMYDKLTSSQIPCLVFSLLSQFARKKPRIALFSNAFLNPLQIAA